MVDEVAKIMIGVTSRDAELFKKFREHQNNFEKLLENGFFDTKAATSVVHFDLDGKIRKIEKIEVVIFPI